MDKLVLPIHKLCIEGTKVNLILLSLLPLCFLGCNQQAAKKDTTPPNVIFIFPDQFRNFSLGIWSEPGYDEFIPGDPDPVSTPALNQLASESVVFSNAVSNFPLCSPYRAMMLSGMYPNSNGVNANCRKDRDVSLRTDAECMSDVFSKAGYAVSYFGKAHYLKNDPVFNKEGTYVGTTDKPGGYYINDYDTYVPPGPDRHGIDYFVQMIKDDHFNPIVYSSDPKVVAGKKDGEQYLPHRFSAEFEAEKIMDYLDNTHGQRNPEQPFFMIWSLNPPHNPWTEESTKMEYFDQYTENGEVKLDGLLKRENAEDTVGDYAPYYFANVSAVDHYIGQVMDKLETLGLSENTIIVFSSDHGEMLGSHGKEGKLVLENESLNIPFMIKWGKKLTHRVEDLVLSVPDVLPTLVSLAGFDELIPSEVQGQNHSNVILGENSHSDDENYALIMNYDSRGLYSKSHTFVVKAKGGVIQEKYCYDNQNDPYQLHKVPFDELPKALQDRLKSRLQRLLKETNDSWYVEKVGDGFLEYS
ncbi:sulfatase [Echinicola strongylocentroti]|uniref:Sulfatase n=1 Tax=Echinicola strongylocentroti TaxID=1795355 RepID=A0A2Z4IRX5_9BACT|nr:sulfatase [Echinicola strongylocentroti]AWW33053.1 sulfatase [Echinicola strongylocentroti]